MSALLSDPINGLSSPDRGPHRLIGWLCYFTVEAYGSLMVALFWSFTNSVMDLEQAKGAYGLIIAIAQLVKELLYNPTSNAIKFKAKAWIDVFGSRLAKAAGISWSAGSDFQHYIENHIVIGENTGLTIYEVESLNLPVRNGLKPGDVGYDGYDLHLFDG
eukprot:gene17245-22773_t